MQLAKSREQILLLLKTRGPQSVKILSNQLDMTTMGIRQHLADLEQKGLVSQTTEEKQTRGRPIHLWRLTRNGHSHFPDEHSQITLELINLMRENLGENSLNQLVARRTNKTVQHYKKALQAVGDDLKSQVKRLAELRSEEGFMAEVRLIPSGWLLIENHCPISVAAKNCQQFCRSELDCFRGVFDQIATVERVDHLLTGSRRCAFKVSPR